MKKILVLTLFIHALLGQFLVAQTENGMTVSSASLQYGVILTPTKDVDISDFQKVVPQSWILSRNYSSFTQNISSGNYASQYLALSLGFGFGKKEKKYLPELHVGINYFTARELKTSLMTMGEATHYDTLISTQTGQMFFLDSIYRQSCFASYSSEQLRFDVAYLYKINAQARFSAFVGMGAAFSTALHSTSQINLSEYSYKTTFNNSFSSSSGFSSRGEIFNNKNNWGFAAYLPVGLDFRLFKKKPIWNCIHLFGEVKAGMSATFIPNYGLLKGVFLQEGVGIRIKN